MATTELYFHSLDRIDPFARMPEHVCRSLGIEADWRRVPEGSLLIDGQSEAAHGVFALADGEVEMFRHVDGCEMPLCTMEAEACFGEFAALQGRPSRTSVRTLTPCLIGEVEADRFLSLLYTHPEAAMPLLGRAVALVRSFDEDLLRLRAREDRLDALFRRALAQTL